MRVRIDSRVRRAVVAGVGAVVVALAVAACSARHSVDIDLPEQVTASLPDATAQQLQDAVSAAMTATGASGALVGVWAPWSGEWTSGIGTTTPGGTQPVSTDMTFRIGHITRSMTCVALHRLASEGTVSLDDRITEYVASVPTLAQVTLRELCDSTSGIGSFGDALRAGWLTNPDRVWDPRELASFGIADADLSAAGGAYRDSDAGYVLLGMALERATKKSAAAVLAREVFDPLGLEHTALPSDTAAAPVVGASDPLPGFVVGPGCAEPIDATVASASSGFTNAGVVSDLRDVAAYTRALAAGSLVPPDTVALGEGFVPFDGAPSWLRTAGGTIHAGAMTGQFGVVHGYSSAAFADPATGLTVVVALNASGADPRIAPYLAWELAAIASKSAPAAGRTVPEGGLPWSAAQFHDEIATLALCPAG